jgi:large subunit ribosomal protein L29
MAATTAGELRNIDTDDLVTKLREAKEELFNLRFQAATGQMEKTHRVSEVRKDIARISTLLREKRAAS